VSGALSQAPQSTKDKLCQLSTNDGCDACREVVESQRGLPPDCFSGLSPLLCFLFIWPAGRRASLSEDGIL